MNNIVIAIVFLVISIAMFTGGILITNSNMYSDAKTKSECDAKGSGNSCGIWMNNKECRKGKKDKDGIICESDGTVIPLILIIFSVILFIMSIFFFIRGFMLKHHQ
jgi:hypothetical protein